MASPSIQHIPVTVGSTDLLLAVAVHDAPESDGQGFPIGWVHGLGAASSSTFAAISQHRMLQPWRSLLIDLPGSGHTPAPDDWSGSIEAMADVVLATISRLFAHPVALFGHSMGGSVAIVAANRRPDLVSHLIVAEPNLDPGVGTTSVAIARQSEQAFVAGGYARLVGATERLARQGNLSASTWLTTLRLANPAMLHRAATSLLASRRPTFREMLLDLPMPVSMIRGEQSALPAPPLPMRPDLRGYVVSGAGHQMFDDNPDAFTSILAHCLSDMA